MRVKRVMENAAEPVSLADVKAHARVDGSADDALLTSLIGAAREWAERYTGRAFLRQGWQAWLDRWPRADELVLRPAPLLRVTAVTLFDEADATRVLDPAGYFVDCIGEPGRLVLRSQAMRPYGLRAANGVMVAFEAGYGDAPEDVPEIIRTAIRQLVAHWYEHRGEELMAGGVQSETVKHYSLFNVPLVIQALLNSYRIQKLVV